jgi:hypothetical protein
LKWLMAIEDPPLSPNEEIQLDSLATLRTDHTVRRGRIILTTQRLVFIPSFIRILPRRFLPWKKIISIPLDNLDAVSLEESLASRLYQGSPLVPLISLKCRDPDGTRFRIQVSGHNEWLKRLQSRVEPSSSRTTI